MVVLPFCFFIPLIRDCIADGLLKTGRRARALIPITVASNGELGGATWTFFSLNAFACKWLSGEIAKKYLLDQKLLIGFFCARLCCMWRVPFER